MPERSATERIVELERENKMLRGELRRVSENAKVGKGFYSDKIFQAFHEAIATSEACKKAYAEACTSSLLGETDD